MTDAVPPVPPSDQPAEKKRPERRPDAGRVQRQASDPGVSAWVTASAGTGKTKVLTDRVLRLMLAGAKPDEILCLTFTRAAAAVMTIRIREELSLWATCPDDELEKRLKALTGDKPDAELTTNARRLFAKFLDTHGGLRIQTIHAFAQDLIRRFPVETKIPPYFDVMDDQTAADLLREAQADVLQETQQNPNTPLAHAIRMVTPEVSEEAFADLMGEITYRRGELLTLIDRDGGIDQTIGKVYRYLGVDPKADVDLLQDQLNSDMGLNGRAPNIQALEDAAEILAGGSAADLEKAKAIKGWLMNPEQRTEIYKDYRSVFVTKDGEVRKKITSKAAAGAEDALRAEADRLLAGDEIIRTHNAARGTESLLRLSDAVLERYSDRKKALNLLDFDDLVYRSNVMLNDKGAGAWAIKKLPGDLRHILIDEAQDTNPDQWQLVSRLVGEFFAEDAGKGGKKRLAGKKALAEKTLFVVGDEKQSIFSFQRADPAEFARRRKYFSALVKASGGIWRDVQMDVAFRSSPAVTTAVDAVFADKDAADGLFSEGDAAEKKVHHEPYRRGQAGQVELHPIMTAPDLPAADAWQPPLTRQDRPDLAMQMAEKIADQIKGWLETGEELPARARPINPSDIMILVRRRSSFVDHMVRALKKRGVPVAGADRVSLSEQIVVQDLTAIAECLLFPDDDYKLACVLKSPVIGLNDEQLEKLAVGRTSTLRASLAAAAGTDPAYKAAHEYLNTLSARLNAQRPYEFYSSIIMNGCPTHQTSGVSAIYNRLGFEAEDALVEFMNAIERFEANHTPTLQGFLSWLAAGEAEVKREVNLNPESPRVHIMTVHGAKGLEAPIVILPDTTGVPADNNKARPRFLWPLGMRDIPLWVPKSDLECQAFTREREKVEQERDREYRRLLYVAMTRAADRLYVYGYQGSDRVKDDSWYALIEKGLAQNLKDRLEIIPVAQPEPQPPAEPKPGDLTPAFNAAAAPAILRLNMPQTARPQPDGIRPLNAGNAVDIPAWARKEAPAPETQAGLFRPSDVLHHEEKKPNRSPFAQGDNAYNRSLGEAVHSLFEHLPLLPPAERQAAAEKYLARPDFALTAEDQKQSAQHVMQVLNHPDFANLFTAAARAEVAIISPVVRDGQIERLSGKIDRLLVDDKTVTVVDFKNNRRVPNGADDVSLDYVLQMAAYRAVLQKMYPDKEVRCALLYTRAAKMIPLAPEQMEAALAKIAFAMPAAPRKAGPKP